MTKVFVNFFSHSNQPETTLTRITRPSPRSLSLPHGRMLQLLLPLPEERWKAGRQGAGEGASSHLESFGSVVGALSRFAGRGGMGADGGEEVGAVARRMGARIGEMGVGAGRRMRVGGERGQGTCRAGQTEQRRCDGSKLNLSHIHLMLYLICCSLYLYICGALFKSSSSQC